MPEEEDRRRRSSSSSGRILNGDSTYRLNSTGIASSHCTCTIRSRSRVQKRICLPEGNNVVAGFPELGALLIWDARLNRNYKTPGLNPLQA